MSGHVPIAHNESLRTTAEQDGAQEAPTPSLPPGIGLLYARLVGREPKPDIAALLARYAAVLGEPRLCAMMLDAHAAVGAITAGSLAITRRTLEPLPAQHDPGARAGASMAPQRDAPELPALPDEPNVAWRAALDELRRVATPHTFNAWLANTRAVAQTDATLTVGVPTLFHATWLQVRLRSQIARALEHAGYGHLHVDFVLNSQKGRHRPRATTYNLED